MIILKPLIYVRWFLLNLDKQKMLASLVLLFVDAVFRLFEASFQVYFVGRIFLNYAIFSYLFMLSGPLQFLAKTNRFVSKNAPFKFFGAVRLIEDILNKPGPAQIGAISKAQKQQKDFKVSKNILLQHPKKFQKEVSQS